MRGLPALSVLGFAAATFAAFCGATSALAQQQQPCPLQERVSLVMTTQSDGSATVPAALNALQVQMMLDTGSLYSAITQSIATKLGLPLGMNPYATLLNNVSPNGYVLLNSLQLGDIASHWGMLVVPDTAFPPAISGFLGQDVLSSFDVEFDFHDGKLNLFLPNTCTTDAAYWTHGPFAAVPFDMNKAAHMVVKAFLDGKQVNVAIDTGASSSIMSLETAKDLFNLGDSDPRLKVVHEVPINGGAPTRISVFPFSALQLEGVAVTNPMIELIPDKNFGREHGVDMILGANVLRRLRFYIAYKENKIYMTDADAK